MVRYIGILIASVLLASCELLPESFEHTNDRDPLSENYIPSSPEGLVLSRSGDVMLTWTDRSEGEDGFMVERALGTQDTFTVIATLPPNTERYQDPVDFPAYSARYRVSSFSKRNGTQVRDLPMEASIEVAVGAGNFQVRHRNELTFELSWTDDNTFTESYEIELRDIHSEFRRILLVPAGTRELVVNPGEDILARPDDGVYFRIRAVARTGPSPYETSLYLPLINMPPPYNFSPEELAPGVLRLWWSHSSPNAVAEYVLERADGPEGAFRVLARVDPESSYFDDSTVETAQTYVYRIRTARSAPSELLKVRYVIGLRLSAGLAGESGEVLSMTFTPDGSRIFAVGSDRMIEEWDPVSGRLLASIRIDGHPEGSSGSRDPRPVSASFSRDGARVATGGRNGVVKLWDTATGAMIRAFSHPPSRNTVALSGDGSLLATAGLDGELRVWSTDTGDIVYQTTAHLGPILSLAFSANGRTLATGGGEGVVHLRDAESGRMRQTLFTFGAAAVSVGFSADGRMVYAGIDGGQLSVWDVESGSLVRTLSQHTNAEFAGGTNGPGPLAAFDPAAETLAAGGTERYYMNPISFSLLDLPSGERLQWISSLAEPVSALVWSPDGMSLAAGTQRGAISLWSRALLWTVLE